MIREFSVLVLVAGICFSGANHLSQQDSNIETTDLTDLKKQRVMLLQERVDSIREWIKFDRACAADLFQPQIDLLNARIEYAKTDAERKVLLGQLLKQYDQLIGMAKLEHQARPSPLASQPVNQVMRAESKLLFLKSERLRIQILHDSIQ